jgi:four helix bundle protein
MPSEFRRLRAYELAVALARDLNGAVSRWDKWERWSLGIQLIRAADSIGANIAEATGRWHVADQRRVLYFARGSLYETEHWIAVAKDRGLLASDADERVPELARTLTGLIRKRERN